MEIVALIIGVLCGFWAANVCENKGRTAWKGFIAGFFFGIFGVAFCYMLSKK